MPVWRGVGGGELLKSLSCDFLGLDSCNPMPGLYTAAIPALDRQGQGQAGQADQELKGILDYKASLKPA